MIIDSPIISGSQLSSAPLFQNGSVQITGSLSVSGSISGANFSGSVVSSSFAVSSSNAESSSFSLTASISLSGTATSASITSLYQNLTAEISASTQIVSTTTKLYDLSAYKGVMMDYVVSTSGSGANMRAGTFTAAWNATSSRSNESMTMDIGDTTAVQFSADKTGSIFVSASSGTWVIDSLYRSIGVGYPTGSAPTPPPVVTASFGYFSQQFTIYTASAIVSESVFYTDAGLTTPYPYVRISSNDYQFLLNPPSGSVNAIGYNYLGSYFGIAVGQSADGISDQALTYPTPYDSLIEAYNNNAAVYNNSGINSYPSVYLPYFTGWNRISDGKYDFDYDDTTGLLSNPILTSVSGGYSVYVYQSASPGNNFNSGNGAKFNRPGRYYYSGSTLDVGTQLYSDNTLTSPAATNQTSSDGYYVYTVDNGLIMNKTAYTLDYYLSHQSFDYVSLDDKCTTGLSGSIDLYFDATFTGQNIWFNATLNNPFYLDSFLTPYTGSDVLSYGGYGYANGRSIYTTSGGNLTYIDACDTFNVGISDISGPDACNEYSSNPISVFGISVTNLASAASSGAPIFYTSTNTQVTGSYISDGTNSYPLSINPSGYKYTIALNSATPC